jgi:hypothetical protein
MARLFLKFTFSLLLAVSLISCGASPDNLLPDPSLLGSGKVFVIGEDAPLPSVLAFQITLNDLSLSNGGGPVSLLSGPTEVEFGRLLGLRALLGLSSIPEGTYDSVTLSMSDPIISFLDLTTTPASVGMLNGTLTTTQITVTLDPPLVVTDGGLAALHLHFPLRDALQVDANGELTGAVEPLIRFRAIPPRSEEAFIEELRGGLSSVEADSNSFTLQTRRGRLLTIHVNDQTLWEEGESLATLTPPAILEISGQILNDGSLSASNVDVLTRDHFLLGGLLLDPDPSIGPADRATLLVREEIPDLNGSQVGQTATVEFGEVTRFDIRNLELPLEFLLFNRGALVRGQRFALGGRIDDSVSPARLRIGRVVLHHQGFQGGHVPGSVGIAEGNRGMFRLFTPGLYGLLFDKPLRVMTSSHTNFDGIDGLEQLAASEDPIPLRVVGFLLRDGDGEPAFVARRVRRIQR